MHNPIGASVRYAHVKSANAKRGCRLCVVCEYVVVLFLFIHYITLEAGDFSVFDFVLIRPVGLASSMGLEFIGT